MGMVRLPNGDMWNPAGTAAEANVANLEQAPEEKPKWSEEDLAGFQFCPWCGQEAEDMAQHAEELHLMELGDQVVEARRLRGED